MSDRFKVIVVGGGPVGLIVAHILSAVNIDYIVLERHSTFETENGSTIAIWPHNVRILDQLGLLDGIRKLDILIHDKVNLRPDGRVIAESDMPYGTGRLHGHKTIVFHRFRLVKFLFDNLPDKSKALAAQEVDNISFEENSATVHCKDGSSHKGSLIIGADGVKSKVRDLMHSLATVHEQDLGEEPPFLSTYRALFGYTKGPLAGMKPGVLFETRGKDVHFQVTTCEAQANFAAYFALPKPTTESPRFTPDQVEEHASQIADLVVHQGGTRFQEVWAQKNWAHLANIEEGLVRHWHWHRIVLVGDSCNKQDPQAAMGLNTGIQNAVALANSLVELLQNQSEPSLSAINRTLTAFQKKREGPTSKDCRTAALTARTAGWRWAPLKFADVHVLPHLGGDLTLLRWVLSPQMKNGVVLDGVEEKNRKDGKLEWARHPRFKGETTKA